MCKWRCLINKGVHWGAKNKKQHPEFTIKRNNKQIHLGVFHRGRMIKLLKKVGVSNEYCALWK